MTMREPRPQQRPTSTVVSFYGRPHRINLDAIERRFLRHVVEGRYSDKAGFAKEIGLSRSTLSRFLRGRQTSLKIVLRVLRALELKFDDVATPLDGD